MKRGDFEIPQGNGKDGQKESNFNLKITNF